MSADIPPRKCRYCGSDFVPKRSQLAEGGPTYCGKQCRLSGQRVNVSRSWDKQHRDDAMRKDVYRQQRNPSTKR